MQERQKLKVQIIIIRIISMVQLDHDTQRHMFDFHDRSEHYMALFRFINNSYVSKDLVKCVIHNFRFAYLMTISKRSPTVKTSNYLTKISS